MVYDPVAQSLRLPVGFDMALGPPAEAALRTRLVPVSTLCPPVAPNSELACRPSPVSLNLSPDSDLRLRYQLQPMCSTITSS